MGTCDLNDGVMCRNEIGSLIIHGKRFNNCGTPKNIVFFPSKMHGERLNNHGTLKIIIFLPTKMYLHTKCLSYTHFDVFKLLLELAS